MTKKMIKHILCAHRGRPESRDTINRAINLALENDARLTFVHVINAEFMGTAKPTLSSLRVVYQQLYEMGEFMMLILVDRATRRGISNVDYIVRQGKAKVELRKIVLNTQPDVLVIGRPVGRSSSDVFKPEEFERFVRDLEKEAEIQIIPVSSDPGENDSPS